MRILWHLARLVTLVFVVAAIGHGLISYIDRLGSPAAHSGVPLHAVTRHHGCQRHGELPDPACTPGASLPDVALTQICHRGYTRTVRTGLTQDTKRAVYAAYGQHHRYNGASGELDHLVPLEAGGSNDPANLWPPASHNKDLVENYDTSPHPPGHRPTRDRHRLDRHLPPRRRRPAGLLWTLNPTQPSGRVVTTHGVRVVASA